MQRSAVDRLTNVFGVVVFWVALCWTLLDTGRYYYLAFFTSHPVWVGDIILMTLLTLWVGWLFAVQVWKAHQDHTGRWFFRNTGVAFSRLGGWLARIFWLWLTCVLMAVIRRLMVAVSWASSKGYPGRGMVFSLDFEDERDFTSMVKSAREEGLPITASKDGRRIFPEEYDAPLTRDADILKTAQTYPPIAKLRVVDATPPTYDDFHDELL